MNIQELVNEIEAAAMQEPNVRSFIDFDVMQQEGFRDLPDVVFGLSLGDPSGEVLTIPATLYAMHRVDNERQTLRYAQSLALAAISNTFNRLIDAKVVLFEPPTYTQVVWENNLVGYSCEVTCITNLSPCYDTAN